MSKLSVTEVLEVCRRLEGRARGAGRRVAGALTERFRHRLPRRGFVDVYELQLALAGELAAMRARFAAWEDRHESEVERGRRLRRRRDRLATEVRGTLLGLKQALTGAFDGATASRILRPVRRLADAPPQVLRQAERLHATLTDPQLDLPVPEPGVEVDPALAARSFEQPMTGLGETLDALAECQGAVRHAGVRRDEALERLAVFAVKVARLYQALAELAGHERSGAE